jgi:hypothetical protein
MQREAQKKMQSPMELPKHAAGRAVGRAVGRAAERRPPEAEARVAVLQGAALRPQMEQRLQASLRSKVRQPKQP